jgi:hypothetical protein
MRSVFVEGMDFKRLDFLEAIEIAPRGTPFSPFALLNTKKIHDLYMQARYLSTATHLL